MARYWVGDAGEQGESAPEPQTPRRCPPSHVPEQEGFADTVRRTLAGNVRADDAE